MFFHPILSAQTMTKLGTRARAPKPLPKSIFLSRGGRGSSNNLRVSILKCPANHARVHSHKKLRKPNPLFTISLQSDGLEIKRKGEGGEKGGKSHGRDEKTKPRFLSRPTSFFFLLGLLGLGFFFCCFQPHVVTLTNDDAGRRLMRGLGALAHYHEQNRALGPALWGPVGNFLGSDLWAQGHPRERCGAAPGWGLG